MTIDLPISKIEQSLDKVSFLKKTDEMIEEMYETERISDDIKIIYQ